MKYFTTFLITIFLSSSLIAKDRTEQKSDLEFKSISYVNNSIPTLSIDLSSKEFSKFDFIIAYANNYFQIQKSLVDKQQREHLYLGFNYRF